MPDTFQQSDFVRSKIRLPRPLPTSVRRPRLEQLLQSGAAGPLTLVCAPAGSGKTTLVTDWIDRQAIATAWLSLDEDDSDLDSFAQYLLRAVHSVYPDACPNTAGLLRSAQDADAVRLAVRLNNELADLPGELIIVLDDYHTIHGAAVHSFMGGLLRGLPDLAHFIVITRVDPPLPLARMRARSQLVEIRSDALRFTRAEIDEMFAQRTGAHLSTSAVIRLEEQTEGWAAGLHLSSLSMTAHSGDAEPETPLTSQASRYITDYLLDEVVLRQPDDVQDFLLRSAPLERFSVPLLAAVLESSEAHLRAMIETVARGNLFLIALDDRDEWYRFHHLFRDLLRRRLVLHAGHEAVRALLLRACDWYAARGAISEAIHYALAAGDRDRAARIVADNLHKALAQDRRLELRHWLNLLPDDLYRDHPALAIAEGWIAMSRNEFGLLAELIRRAQRLLESGAEPDPEIARLLRAEIACLRTFAAFYALEPERVLEASRRALADLPAAWSYERGLCHLYQSTVMAGTGDPDGARRSAREIIARSQPGSVSEMLALLSLVSINLFDTNLDEAGRAAMALREASIAARHTHLRPYANSALGRVSYERNQISEALAWYADSSTVESTSNLTGILDCISGAVFCHIVMGALDKAQQAAAQCEELSNLSRNPVLANLALALNASVTLARGDLAGAILLADQIDPSMAIHPLRVVSPAIARVRIHLQAPSVELAERACREIEVLERQVRTILNRRMLVRVLSMKAVALYKCGRREPALEALSQSLVEGSKLGLVRTWLDMGQPLFTLLEMVTDDSNADSAVTAVARHILTVARASPRVEARMPHDVRTQTPPARSAPSLPMEHLTARESEVVRFLSLRYTDKEIAESMVVSVTTVRSHIDSIFTKLGVTDRRAAAARARELGLVDDTSNRRLPPH